jgi:hypothetical protein
MNLKSLKIFIFLSVFAALLLLSNPQSASANATHNLRGWANNSTYGYISFNCLDDGYAGHFPFTFPFIFNIAPCAYNQHGVNLDVNYNFSGEAWNSVLGFIDFYASSTPSDDFRSLCNNGNTCTTASSCTACYNENDGKVYGYMKVRGGEWIRLDNSSTLPTTQMSNYLAPQPGIFSGFTSSTFGSISFNCSDLGVCGVNNYFVKIGKIETRQMTAPNWGSDQACSQLANQAVLKWNIRGGTQTAYQVIVNNSDSTSTPVFDSGQVNTTAKQVQISGLLYNKDYYWWLRLWDVNGPTAWRQFNTSGTKDIITDPYAGGSYTKSFKSYKHEFPHPAFTWSPTEIIIATTSNSFVSNSFYFNDGNVLQPCNGNICKLVWSTTPSWMSTITSSTSAATSIMFTRATSTTVILSSTDDAYYTCSTSTSLNANYALPLWKEVNATSTQ